VISQAPRAFIIKDFLSSFEVRHIITYASPNLHKSLVGDSEGGGIQESTTRTSKNTWMNRGHSLISETLARRAADLLQVDEVLLTTHEVDHDPPVNTLPLPPLDPADLGVATLPAKQPTVSLLHFPVRALTRADFPRSQAPTEEDLPSPTPEDAPPYHRRFLPQPLILPIDESRCPPIGNWPSALAQKWTSPELYVELPPMHPGTLRYGLQPLHSTAGPFSVFGSINHGQDTVLTL